MVSKLKNRSLLDTDVSPSSRDYVASGFVSIIGGSSPADLAGRLIGLNELRPTGAEIEKAMYDQSGRKPQVAYETVEEMARQAEQQGRLDALVRKKMGDGTHGVGDDIWEVEGYQKVSLAEFVRRAPLDDPLYVPRSEDTLHFLDHYFE